MRLYAPTFQQSDKSCPNTTGPIVPLTIHHHTFRVGHRGLPNAPTLFRFTRVAAPGSTGKLMGLAVVMVIPPMENSVKPDRPRALLVSEFPVSNGAVVAPGEQLLLPSTPTQRPRRRSIRRRQSRRTRRTNTGPRLLRCREWV